MNETAFWLGFSRVAGIGARHLENLLAVCGDIASAWQASEARLRQAGIDRRARDSFLHQRERLDLARELEHLQRLDARLLTHRSADYPPALRNIPDPPPWLFQRGTFSDADRIAMGVVGTRKPSSYGLDMAFQLSRDLAQEGITIVSGLAQGIDAAAHRGALEGGGRTLAVFGCGIDRIYPAVHHRLAEEILESGALLSEFPPGVPPLGKNFPRRNRLISGLSMGILVVEAPLGSGAMITANMALEQGRDVFALPGNVLRANSKGPHQLIQEGAKLVHNVNDILEELQITREREETRSIAEEAVPENETEALLLENMGVEPVHIDDLARACQMPVARISSTLTILELRGLARKTGPMQYCRRHSL